MLTDPVFIGGYHVSNVEPMQDKVMVFFREKAEEFLPYKFGMASDPNERNIVTRVATVCVVSLLYIDATIVDTCYRFTAYNLLYFGPFFNFNKENVSN